MNKWIPTKEKMPADGQEVIVRMTHRQIRQATRDTGFMGGWKQHNCAGWEAVSPCSDTITHWRDAVVKNAVEIEKLRAKWREKFETEDAAWDTWMVARREGCHLEAQAAFDEMKKTRTAEARAWKKYHDAARDAEGEVERVKKLEEDRVWRDKQAAKEEKS